MTIIFYFIIFVPTVIAGFTIPQVPQVNCEKSTNQFYPYPKICNIYYECEKGQRNIKICQLGLNFNPKLGICDHTEPKECAIVQKKIIEDTFCPKMFIGHVPDPDNCTQFIICFLGTHRYRNCELNFVYNHNTGFCDHLRNVPECSENMKRHNTANKISNYNFNPYDMDYPDNDDDETDDSFNQIISQKSQSTDSKNAQRTDSLHRYWTRHGGLGPTFFN